MIRAAPRKGTPALLPLAPLPSATDEKYFLKYADLCVIMFNMKKYALLIPIVIPAAILLCGCEEYHPSNSPRETMTMKSNFLTTVTTSETSRADTYSEYISSLKEAGAEYASPRSGSDRSEFIGGMQRDTAVSRHTETAFPAVTAVTAPEENSVPELTAVTKATSPAVTAVPEESSGSEASTSVCETRREMEAVTAPPFGIDDIPSVPSAEVHADTALRGAEN